MYIPFEQHELIDQKYSTVDSQRSLSAENRFTTDGNDSSLYLAYSLVTANDRTSSMDTNGKSHEKSTPTRVKINMFIKMLHLITRMISKNQTTRVENVCPPTGRK
jgi:hypothetical protein